MTDATDATDETREGAVGPGGAESGAAEPAYAAASPSMAAPFTEGERVARGIALALLIIPVGVIAWTILWNIGFIASIVSWGVAVGALWLYRAGSKARVTRGAFWGIVAIVVVTVALSLLAGIFSDLAGVTGIPLFEALTRPDFWQLFADNIFDNPAMWQAYLPQVVLALLFAALGCFMTLRRLGREAQG